MADAGKGLRGQEGENLIAFNICFPCLGVQRVTGTIHQYMVQCAASQDKLVINCWELKKEEKSDEPGQLEQMWGGAGGPGSNLM